MCSYNNDMIEAEVISLEIKESCGGVDKFYFFCVLQF